MLLFRWRNQQAVLQKEEMCRETKEEPSEDVTFPSAEQEGPSNFTRQVCGAKKNKRSAFPTSLEKKLRSCEVGKTDLTFFFLAL